MDHTLMVMLGEYCKDRESLVNRDPVTGQCGST